MKPSDFQHQLEPTEPAPHPAEQDRGYHIEIISRGTLFAWGFAILCLLALAVAVSWGLWSWLNDQTPKAAFLVDDQQSRLDPHQRQTRLKYEQEQQKLLSSYGWVEPEREIAHIPIERAMSLYIERRNP